MSEDKQSALFTAFPLFSCLLSVFSVCNPRLRSFSVMSGCGQKTAYLSIKYSSTSTPSTIR